jgi:hypothetical protein
LFNSRCALRPFFQSRFRSNPAPVAALCERRRAIPHWRSQTCAQRPRGASEPSREAAKSRRIFKTSRRDAETQGKES